MTLTCLVVCVFKEWLFPSLNLGSLNLDEEKKKIILLLTSNRNLTFPLIINIGNKHITYAISTCKIYIYFYLYPIRIISDILKYY